MGSQLSPRQCAEHIAKAGKIVVLTGAGISTSAGVPDFRGPKGLYVTRAYDPETVFDIGYFDRDPEPFYAFTRDFLAMLDGIEPTLTHHFLTRLEQTGRLLGLVTQNIDGLHQRAGSTHIIPIHGDYSTAHCRRCRAGMSGEDLRRLLGERPGVPRCAACGGTIKPDVVFFGENVNGLGRAVTWSDDADLFLALGTSLAVHPAASLPDATRGVVIIVNKGAIALRPGPDRFVVDAYLDDYFGEVEKELSRIRLE